jgi:hypothetical protein
VRPGGDEENTIRQARRTPLLEELGDDSNEISKREVIVGHQSFNLMELGQVGGIQSLISEHSIDGEVLLGRERLLLACEKGNGTAEVERLSART